MPSSSAVPENDCKSLLRVPRFIDGNWQWIEDTVTRADAFSIRWSPDAR